MLSLPDGKDAFVAYEKSVLLSYVLVSSAFKTTHCDMITNYQSQHSQIIIPQWQILTNKDQLHVRLKQGNKGRLDTLLGSQDVTS